MIYMRIDFAGLGSSSMPFDSLTEALEFVAGVASAPDFGVSGIEIIDGDRAFHISFGKVSTDDVDDTVESLDILSQLPACRHQAS